MRSCMTNMECLSFPVTMDIALSLTESKRSGWQAPRRWEWSFLGAYLRLPLPLFAAVEARQRGTPKREFCY